MEKFLNNLENAAFQLKDKGEQALKKAGPALQQGLEKAKPVLEEGLERAKDAYEKAKPTLRENFERVMNKAASAYERAAENFSQDGKAAPAEPADSKEDPDSQESIDLEVEAQVEKIRAARQEPNVISDYISKKFGKDDQ